MRIKFFTDSITCCLSIWLRGFFIKRNISLISLILENWFIEEGYDVTEFNLFSILSTPISFRFCGRNWSCWCFFFLLCVCVCLLWVLRSNWFLSSTYFAYSNCVYNHHIFFCLIKLFNQLNSNLIASSNSVNRFFFCR